MKKYLLSFFMLCGCLGVSCSQKNPMVGTWVAKEAGNIMHYLEFDATGHGTYYFDSALTGTSSVSRFSYTYEESVSDLINDKVDLNANCAKGEYASIILGGEIVAPNMLECKAMTSGNNYSLTFRKK